MAGVSAVPERDVEDDDTVVELFTRSDNDNMRETSVEYLNVHVFDFEDGKIVQWRSYTDTGLFHAMLEDEPVHPCLPASESPNDLSVNCSLTPSNANP